MRISLTDAQRILGALLSGGGLLLFAERSLVRVWVSAQKEPGVLPYRGELLLGVAIIACAAGLALLTISFQVSRSRKIAASSTLATCALFAAGFAGILAAGVCQAWLHTAHLAIVGGWMHPRSLVGASLFCVVVGVAIFGGSIEKDTDNH